MISALDTITVNALWELVCNWTSNKIQTQWIMRPYTFFGLVEATVHSVWVLARYYAKKQTPQQQQTSKQRNYLKKAASVSYTFASISTNTIESHRVDVLVDSTNFVYSLIYTNNTKKPLIHHTIGSAKSREIVCLIVFFLSFFCSCGSLTGLWLSLVRLLVGFLILLNNSIKVHVTYYVFVQVQMNKPVSGMLHKTL